MAKILSGKALFEKIEQDEEMLKWLEDKKDKSKEMIEMLTNHLKNLNDYKIDVKLHTPAEENNPNLELNHDTIRKFALMVLDDPEGIRFDAMEIFSNILVETGNEDILNAVDCTDDRAYIGETYAEEELAKLT